MPPGRRVRGTGHPGFVPKIKSPGVMKCYICRRRLAASSCEQGHARAGRSARGRARAQIGSGVGGAVPHGREQPPVDLGRDGARRARERTRRAASEFGEFLEFFALALDHLSRSRALCAANTSKLSCGAGRALGDCDEPKSSSDCGSEGRDAVSAATWGHAMGHVSHTDHVKRR